MVTIDPESWYRRRGYLHFDRAVGQKRAVNLVTDPEKVAKHSFYPLISYEIESTKISKSSGVLARSKKKRPIAYAAHLDSHIYSYYAKILEQEYEEFILDCDLHDSILAFRSLGKSNIHFASIAFNNIRERKNCAVVALDVKGFFDNLNHHLLKNAWCNILKAGNLPQNHYNVYKSITKFASVDRNKLYSKFGIAKHNPKRGRERVCSASSFRNIVRGSGLVKKNLKNFGIPQGTPISAILSNIYMMDFDKEAKKYASSLNGEYFRYCDDILLIVPTKERDRAAGKIAQIIKKSKLEINIKKTSRHTFSYKKGKISVTDKPLQYLGFTFDGEQILVRSSAFSRYSEKMKRGVKLAKATQSRWNKIRLSRGQSLKVLYKKSLYKKYSHLGKRNFIRYGFRASEIMKSGAIRGQLKPLWKRLLVEISKK